MSYGSIYGTDFEYIQKFIGFLFFRIPNACLNLNDRDWRNEEIKSLCGKGFEELHHLVISPQIGDKNIRVKKISLRNQRSRSHSSGFRRIVGAGSPSRRHPQSFLNQDGLNPSMPHPSFQESLAAL